MNPLESRVSKGHAVGLIYLNGTSGICPLPEVGTYPEGYLLRRKNIGKLCPTLGKGPAPVLVEDYGMRGKCDHIQ